MDSIINESSSTKQVRKVMTKGTFLFLRTKNQNGQLVTSCEEMAKTVSEFYQGLYHIDQ